MEKIREIVDMVLLEGLLNYFEYSGNVKGSNKIIFILTEKDIAPKAASIKKKYQR